MSLFSIPKMMKPLLAAGIAVAVLAAAGCTVQPLYGTDSTGAVQTSAAGLSEITIKPADSRAELEVRNYLIFLLAGGAGLPDTAPYSLSLGVTSKTSSTLNNQIIIDPTTNEGQPTAGIVTMTSSYSLVDTKTGETVAAGERSVSAEFDRPRQEFASDRAERNAQDRAARELAELLRLALAQDFRRLKGS